MTPLFSDVCFYSHFCVTWTDPYRESPFYLECWARIHYITPFVSNFGRFSVRCRQHHRRQLKYFADTSTLFEQPLLVQRLLSLEALFNLLTARCLITLGLPRRDLPLGQQLPS